MDTHFVTCVGLSDREPLSTVCAHCHFSQQRRSRSVQEWCLLVPVDFLHLVVIWSTEVHHPPLLAARPFFWPMTFLLKPLHFCIEANSKLRKVSICRLCCFHSLSDASGCRRQRDREFLEGTHYHSSSWVQKWKCSYVWPGTLPEHFNGSDIISICCISMLSPLFPYSNAVCSVWQCFCWNFTEFYLSKIFYCLWLSKWSLITQWLVQSKRQGY